jgi:hypothetical protein
MWGNEMKPATIEALERFKADTGEDNVAFLDLPNINEITVGSHGHPGYKSHIESARVIGEYLSKKFGRPYEEPLGNL